MSMKQIKEEWLLISEDGILGGFTPEGITKLHEDCNSEYVLNIPSSVRAIAECAFSVNSDTFDNVKEIVIPSSVCESADGQWGIVPRECLISEDDKDYEEGSVIFFTDTFTSFIGLKKIACNCKYSFFDIFSLPETDVKIELDAEAEDYGLHEKCKVQYRVISKD